MVTLWAAGTVLGIAVPCYPGTCLPGNRRESLARESKEREHTEPLEKGAGIAGCHLLEGWSEMTKVGVPEKDMGVYLGTVRSPPVQPLPGGC